MSTTSDTMLEALIQGTAQLIEEAPLLLSLTRRSEAQKDASGGHSPGAPVDLDPVRRTLVPIDPQSSSVANAGDYGEEWRVLSTLVGMPGDDIQVNDTFVIDDIEHRVVFVFEDKTYQVKADVAVRIPSKP